MSPSCEYMLAMARASGNKAQALGFLRQAQEELDAAERGLEEQRAVFAASGVADALIAYEQMWRNFLADKEIVQKALDQLLAT